MITALRHYDQLTYDLINQSMLRCNTSREIPLKIFFEAFRFAQTIGIVRVAFDVCNQRVDSPEDLFVILYPMLIIFPSTIRKPDDHILPPNQVTTSNFDAAISFTGKAGF